jgi:ketosteroid isomerase-like protein
VERVLGAVCVLCLLLAACGDGVSASTTATTTTTTTTAAATTTAVPQRVPIAAADLEALVGRLTPIVQAHAAAWDARDVEGILALYTPETVFEDTGFGDLVSGEELRGFLRGVFISAPLMRFRLTDLFVGREGAVAVDDWYGLTLRSHQFTEDDPVVEADRFDISEGKIDHWTLYYSLATYQTWGGLDSRMADATTLLEGYAAAWSSGSPEQVADLYAPDAVRQDTLFDDTEQGPEAIAAFAADFFAWYPGVTWVQTLGFSDSRNAVNDPEQVGAVFDATVPTADGMCPVRIAVILTASHGKILGERLYYDPETVTTCSWAS